MKRILIFLSACTLLHAQEAAPQAGAAEAKLRESLRSTMLQLRTAESAHAALQAAQAAGEAKVKSLETQLSQSKKEAALQSTAAERTEAGLRAKLTAAEQTAEQLNVSLGKWKKAYAEAAAAAQKNEVAHTKAAAAAAAQQSRAEQRERQNLELYKTGREILERYENFSLGRALAAREPFTGIAKARLEALVQEYRDRLEDQKMKAAPATRPKASAGS